MTPETLEAIRARDAKGGASVSGGAVQQLLRDRRALLDYVEELEETQRQWDMLSLVELSDKCKLLEAALDWAVTTWNPESHGWFKAPPHLSTVLEASRKRIQGPTDGREGEP